MSSLVFSDFSLSFFHSTRIGSYRLSVCGYSYLPTPTLVRRSSPHSQQRSFDHWATKVFPQLRVRREGTSCKKSAYLLALFVRWSTQIPPNRPPGQDPLAVSINPASYTGSTPLQPHPFPAMTPPTATTTGTITRIMKKYVRSRW